MENPIYKKSTLYHLFNHCLLSANHKPQSILYAGATVLLKAGEFATTLKEISEKTGIKKPTVYKGLKTLFNLELISQKSKQRMTIISVINWHSYQNKVNDKETIGKRSVNDRETTLPANPRPARDCETDKNVRMKEIYTQSEAVYSSYPRKADKNNSIKSIVKLLKTGIEKESLLRAIENYKAQIEQKGTGRDYVIQSNNFFGKAARYKEFIEMTEQKEVSPIERAMQRVKERGDY